jgi:hypothetical protein
MFIAAAAARAAIAEQQTPESFFRSILRNHPLAAARGMRGESWARP